MRAHLKFSALLFCILSFTHNPSVVTASNAKHTGAKAYPYCDDIFSPSIPCDEKYPNGTYIDGNRPDPLSPCSNIFFMCVDGTSYCFNCQNEPPIELYYDFSNNKCLYPEEIAACNGCSNGVCPTSQSPASSTVSTTQGVPDSTTTSMITTETTEEPTTTDPTCLSFEEHLIHLQ